MRVRFALSFAFAILSAAFVACGRSELPELARSEFVGSPGAGASTSSSGGAGGAVSPNDASSISNGAGSGGGCKATGIAFETGPILTVGATLGGLAVADLNADGKLDIAVVDSASNTVSVFLGHGDGTFQPATGSAEAEHPFAIAVADFDGDGRLDLAVANTNDVDVAVLRGNGDGTFVAAGSYAVASLPHSLVTRDFNGDHLVDIAVVEVDGVSMLLGHGDGAFDLALDLPLDVQPGSPAAGDWNSDGKLDLAAAYNGSGVLLLLGDGKGGFTSTIDSVGQASIALAEGNIDGDDKPDLVIADNPTGDISGLIGHGDGTFEQVSPSTPGDGAFISSVVLADFDGDGKVDAATTSYEENEVVLLAGHGDGTFAPVLHAPVGAGPIRIGMGDFNGDGRADLATSNQYDGTVSILLNVCPE